MKETIGLDIFDQIPLADAICITTNCSIIDNKNPMDGGVAGLAKKKWPYIEYIYGKLLQYVPKVPVILGFIRKKDMIFYSENVQDDSTCALIAFPTMPSISQYADLSLIIRNTELLSEMADQYNWKNVYLAAPGIGIGGLSYKDVHHEIKDILNNRFIVMRK